MAMSAGSVTHLHGVQDVNSNYEKRKAGYVATWQQTKYSGVHAQALYVGSVHVHAVHGRRAAPAL